MATVLVIGSGIAGLVTAITAAAGHRVTVVTKGAVGESNTRRAQGGIAGVMTSAHDRQAAGLPLDSVDAHITDTLAAGAGLCDPDAVRVLCTEASARLHDLADWGVEFDGVDGVPARGLEAAHSAPRVLHAGGDATGEAIQRALITRAKRSGVMIREHTVLVDLLRDPTGVRGALLLTPDGDLVEVRADAVVLATGGLGQLFEHTTNPAVATGDGLAAAIRAGAAVADLEFYQFHPTAMTGTGFLLSEAVRGEGAVLRDGEGRRFMQNLHPAAELAPRDVVARGIAQVMASRGGPVTLDATALGAAHLSARFPSVDAAVRAAGIDWSRTGVPVAPAAHYAMGGIVTDLWGRTNLPGLLAVGEVARTGVHGANRLASNSLLEGAVFGARAASALDRLPAGTDAHPPTISRARRQRFAFVGEVRQKLQKLMWEHVGLLRDGAGLQTAAETLARWSREFDDGTDLETGADGIRQVENRNLVTIASAMTDAAIRRTESRGAHFRSDHPRSDPTRAIPTIFVTDAQEALVC
ncbi:L-aspartate oxidase [Okibacterium endophyticum]